MSQGSKVMVLKIVLLGSWGVGKSSLRRTYMGGRLKKNYLPTVGADFSLKHQIIDNESYQLLIWDISGEKKFENVREVYLQGAYGALVIFDLTRRESFEDLSNWIDSLDVSSQTKGIPLIILGNKVDLTPHEMNQVVTNQEIKQFVDNLNERYNGLFRINYFATSALSGVNVDEAYTDLIRQIRKWLPIRNREIKRKRSRAS